MIAQPADACYEPLCSYCTGFWISNSQQSDVFICDIEKRSSVCIEDIGMTTCHLDTTKRITLRGFSSGRRFLKTVSHQPDDFGNHSLKYYFVELERRPAVVSWVRYPSVMYGHIISTRTLNLIYEADELAVRDSAYIEMSITGLSTHRLDPRHISLSSTMVEPASWFFTLTPMFRDPQKGGAKVQRGYVNPGYIEFVLSPDEINRQRKFSKPSATSSSQFDFSPRNDSIPLNKTKTVHVCIWANNKLDGQKTIWIQQLVHMHSPQFSFTWVLTADEDDTGPGTVLNRLKELTRDIIKFNPARSEVTISAELKAISGRDIAIVRSPLSKFSIPAALLTEDPGDGSRIFSPCEEQNSGIKERSSTDCDADIYKYISDRLRLYNFDIDRTTPTWVRDAYSVLREHILSPRGAEEESSSLNHEVKSSIDRETSSSFSQQDLLLRIKSGKQPYKIGGCDVLVRGTFRGFANDVLISDTARATGVASVAELNNLFMDPYLVPTVVVGPSRYSIEHESFDDLDAKLASMQPAIPSPSKIVIAPSVDSMGRFNGSSVIPHGEASETCKKKSLENEMRIGFMARLSPEKNPGLFIMAAHALLILLQQSSEDRQAAHANVKFVVIGHGPIKRHLEELADRLNIAHAVDFLGWIDAALPRVLASIDVMVNPSIRGWSETFCIANLESMSMGIPLVTFAVGGIGEYVNKPEEVDIDTSFQVTNNAVVVNHATPLAIATAVHLLLRNQSLRLAIGTAGRETVMRYFTLERQLSAYGSLYEQLAANNQHGKNS